MIRILFSIVLLVMPAESLAGPQRPVARGDIAPNAQWDFHPNGPEWTAATLKALRAHGSELLTSVPADVVHWCPAYKQNNAQARAAFWTGLLSSLAKYESTWKPRAVGGGGRWFGLVQIAPATARGYGCKARTGAQLQRGAANLSCAVRIWAQTVQRDGAIALREGELVGIAADWGPMRYSKKRETMARYTRNQRYCQIGSSPRPEMKSG